MKIKAQNGKVYEVYNVEMKLHIIKCADLKDKRRKHILGEYKNSERACEVMAEIAVHGWRKEEIFEMPMN